MEPEELREVDRLLDGVEAEFDGLDSDDALHRATVLAHRLPARVRRALNEFRLERLSGVLIISGHQVDQDRVGPTPRHWRDRTGHSSAHREELLLVLYGSLLGDPFAWTTQQDGRLIHDVIPIKGHENEQLGSSSEALLTWHTEDAFHPLRSDFIGFACLRNPYGAATTIGHVDDLELPGEVREVLTGARFGIRPDESHLPKNNSAPAEEAFEAIERLDRAPDPVPVLFGHPERPYIRADPYFMSVDAADREARAALDALTERMDARMVDMRLEAGDFCFLDNYRVVHGRKPFQARHDGTDRWLKRINLTKDLRKSRAERAARDVRAIG